jgi:uncharacterized membrane protein
MGRISYRIPERLNRRIGIILLTMAVSMTPIWIAIAQSPVIVDIFTIDVEVTEALSLNKTAFMFNMKPGECESDEVTISNSADVSLNAILAPIITPNNPQAGFDLQIIVAHSIQAHTSIDVPFTVCLDPRGIVQDYHVDVQLIR